MRGGDEGFRNETQCSRKLLKRSMRKWKVKRPEGLPTRKTQLEKRWVIAENPMDYCVLDELLASFHVLVFKV